MEKCIIGKKVGMTQIFEEDGRMIPVTVIEAGPCVVTQIKTTENDGYEAVQIGFGEISSKAVNKPRQGHFDKNDLPAKRHLKEFRVDDIGAYNINDILKADIFAEGDIVDVKGTSKGKGFQGVIKRHNQKIQRNSHGGKKNHRKPGSIGNATDPGRVVKGTKLPGHMGNENVTVQNLVIVKVDAENNLIAIRGAVPGPKGGIVQIVNGVKA